MILKFTYLENLVGSKKSEIRTKYIQVHTRGTAPLESVEILHDFSNGVCTKPLFVTIKYPRLLKSVLVSKRIEKNAHTSHAF